MMKLTWTLPISVFLITSLFTLVACGPGQSTRIHRPGIDSAPGVRAPDKIDAAFVAAPGAAGAATSTSALSARDKSRVAIRKDALEKEFLLHGSLIPQTGMATSQGLQARVVAFRRVEDRLFLLEATQGHVIARELPATLILAEIPILSETEDTIVMDFNAGMSQAFVTSNWKGSEAEKKGKPSYKESFNILNVRHSYLDSVKTVEGPTGPTLEIRQIAQVEGTDKVSKEPTAKTVDLRYYLSPYRPSPGFVPREASDYRNVGFFEIGTQLEESSGRPLARISRWDHTKPITFHVSANTPPEYLDAVKEGILYWNHAFGREVLRAEMAPADVTAPDPRYNIVQWVPNDTAGFAYADALMDPRTGEILHAQVYLTSVFGLGPRAKLPSILRKLRHQHENADAPASLGTLGTRALGSARLCEFDGGKALAQDMERLMTSSLGEDAFLRAAQDYIREVAAHEVGHTLGLRHNFAGSLAQNMSMVERDRLLLDYLKNGTVPPAEKVFTSSMMEYTAFAESVLAAAQSKALGLGFSYDKVALAWGYDGKEVDAASAPLFCTDGHTTMKYADCVRHDSGASPVASNQQKLRLALDSLPLNLVEAFIRTKTQADPRDRVAFEKLEIQPDDFLEPITSEAIPALIGLIAAEPAPLLSIERQFPYINPLNKEDVQKLQRERIADEVRAAGGLDALFFGLLPAADRDAPSFALKANESLVSYLARKDVLEGIGYDGKPYALTKDEATFIQRTGGKLFAHVERALLERAIELLSSAKFGTPELGPELEERLGQLAKAIILEQEGLSGALRPFRYPRQLRFKAAGLLSSSLGEKHMIDWSRKARKEVQDALETMLKSIPKDVELSRRQQQWKLEQEELVDEL